MSLTSENVVVHRPKSFNSYSISRTEKFADLEIQCDDQAWKVHKIVVCDKSSVLNIALTNEWQEAAENVYRILDFDPAIVNRMLDFMYGGHYESEETDSNDILFHSLLANVKAKDSLGADVAINSTVASLFIHLEMNSIADFYDVYQLREAALDRIRDILTQSWNQVVNWYPAFLEATFKKTTESNLHSLLVDASLPHAEELNGLVFGGSANVDVPASFFSGLLGKVYKDTTPLAKSNFGETVMNFLEANFCDYCHRQDGTVSEVPNHSTTFIDNTRTVIVWYHQEQELKRLCQRCKCVLRPRN